MRTFMDPLYTIFEQHLYNALVENETTDEFLDRVVADYLTRLTSEGTIPHEHRASIEVDLKDEVLDMLRKKTYGHFNLTEFRKAKAATHSFNTSEASAANTKTRRTSRAS